MEKSMQSRVVVFSLSFIICAISIQGCVFKGAIAPGVMVPSFLEVEKLTRQEYEILGDVEGHGCATFHSLFPLPIFWVSDEGKAGTLIGLSARGSAKQTAIYHALHSVPGADAILMPRFYTKTKSIFIWYRKTCATVKGKAIRIKIDKELTN
ncbi:hypothetical protein ACFL27_03870 [candidate division CSSED10-310 bacterium]|uniref:Lipoprotein n=1 Tax=candidate division CSSED10-310 bacterium TaxID=2855610 RepID=A0ABV6YT11_UNCC1